MVIFNLFGIFSRSFVRIQVYVNNLMSHVYCISTLFAQLEFPSLTRMLYLYLISLCYPTFTNKSKLKCKFFLNLCVFIFSQVQYRRIERRHEVLLKKHLFPYLPTLKCILSTKYIYIYIEGRIEIFLSNLRLHLRSQKVVESNTVR